MDPISIVAGIFVVLAVGIGLGAPKQSEPLRVVTPDLIQEIKACRMLCGKNRTLSFDRETGECQCINSK